VHHPTPSTVWAANICVCRRAGFIPHAKSKRARHHPLPGLPLLFIYANIILTFHAPAPSRPFDKALIDTPRRFIVILPISFLFLVSLLYTHPPSPTFLLWRLVCSITLHSTYNPGILEYRNLLWPGLLVVLLGNFLGLLVIVTSRDFV
jgi:hypothetical protein